MEVECPRHPGASTIGSQLLGEIAPIAGKSLQPGHEPPRTREKRGTRHTDIVYTVEKRGRVGGGGTPQKLCLNVEWR